MGDIDTQILKLYAEDDLFLSEVIKDDAELLMLDSWLMDTLGKTHLQWKLKTENWKVWYASHKFYKHASQTPYFSVLTFQFSD